MKPRGALIVDELFALLRHELSSVADRADISQNVVELRGAATCLIYVHGRANAPYRWGVTNNVLTRLRRQKLPWFVVLLHDGAQTGYVLSAAEVAHCTESVWPLGADGDYKPAVGSYLALGTHFLSLGAFLEYVRAS